MEDKLKKYVKSLEINNYVKFENNYLSKEPRNFIYNELKKADVFVLPGADTLNDYGGTPIVLMEAGAMSLPSITCNNAGNIEIVQNKKTGLVAKKCDHKDISKNMEKLLNDQKLRNELGKNARNFIVKNFNLENQTKALIDVYNNIS